MSKKIKISLEENILKVLNDFESMGYKIVSHKIKDIVSKEAFDELIKIYMKYHNANCGPFNRTLKELIKEEKENE